VAPSLKVGRAVAPSLKVGRVQNKPIQGQKTRNRVGGYRFYLINIDDWFFWTQCFVIKTFLVSFPLIGGRHQANSFKAVTDKKISVVLGLDL